MVEAIRTFKKQPDWTASGVPPDIARVFARFDEDNSGTIEAKELRPALKLLGIEGNSDETRAILL
eukprot:3593132-Prymnesium_polylepis.1